MTASVAVTRDDAPDLIIHHLGGSGDQPLLISHATGFHGRCYEEMASLLSDRWSVWALDYRGHGLTRATDQPLVNWQPFAQDALAAARHLAPDGGLVAFGHSMGGAAVLMAHLIDPTAFRRLVAFEPIAPPPTEGMNPDDLPIVQGAMRRRPSFESIEAALENYSAKRPMMAFTRRSLEAYVRHGMEETSDRGAVLRCVPTFEASVFRSAHTNHLWEKLPEIDLSTAVIAGVVETHQPSAFAAAVADRLPNGTLYSRPDLDHFGPFVEPAACSALVDDILSAGS